jgi:hypothetical protein
MASRSCECGCRVQVFPRNRQRQPHPHVTEAARSPSGNAPIIREGHGTGEGWGSFAGGVHGIALKAAETDATKRTLAIFGSRLGLMLYDRSKAEDKRRESSRSTILTSKETLSDPEKMLGITDIQIVRGGSRRIPTRLIRAVWLSQYRSDCAIVLISSMWLCSLV